MRRPFADQSTSRLAVMSGRLVLFALLVAGLSVIIVRANLLEIVPALTTFAAALILAAIAVVIAFAAFVAIWRTGLGGLGQAISGLLIGSLLLAYPAYLGYRAYQLPAIADITTDPANPPRFDVTARLRPRGTNDYPGGATSERQRAAYPEITPLQLGVPPKTAYEAALAIVTQRKWRVVDARAPGPGRRDGTIEAVARTPIMAFRDDVVIRVSVLGNGSRIDVRSASRYGTHDFGTNAARVRSLLDDIEEAIGTAPEPKPEPAKKPQPGAKRPSTKR